MICLVHDGHDRAVLARQTLWPQRLFSILAGFVEAGESFESCVVREIAEEIGLTVTDVEYLGSQPWPFPRSLMIGFHAIGDPEQEFSFNDGEIAEAAWFTRSEIREALEQGGTGAAAARRGCCCLGPSPSPGRSSSPGRRWIKARRFVRGGRSARRSHSEIDTMAATTPQAPSDRSRDVNLDPRRGTPDHTRLTRVHQRGEPFVGLVERHRERADRLLPHPRPVRRERREQVAQHVEARRLQPVDQLGGVLQPPYLSTVVGKKQDPQPVDGHIRVGGDGFAQVVADGVVLNGGRRRPPPRGR